MKIADNAKNSPIPVAGAFPQENRFAANFRRFAARFFSRSENSAAPAEEIAAKGGVVAEQTSPELPFGISKSLASILRPAAAYRWLMPNVAAITPQYIEVVLRGALAGNHVQQWELFDLMLDTWPELAACQQELRDAVMERSTIFTPFSDDDDEPTPDAVERCKTVSAALRRMRPDAAKDENALKGTISDLIDGWFRGVTVLETDWHVTDAGATGRIIGPRATYWVHPVCFCFDVNGRLGLRTDAGTIGGLGHVSAQPSPAQVAEFPPHKFLVGIHKAKSGSALGGALLRPLAWWWAAANFSADWLLNLAQVFGLPFRWANYDPQAPQETVDRICQMLQNMGSAGWAAFPEGTTLELKESSKTGDHSPQGELLDRADRYARLLILGQTMSGSQDASKGGGKAFGSVESDVKAQRANAVAEYVAGIFNDQLIPSIVTLNYGDCDDCPVFDLLQEEEGDYTTAQRDTLLAKSGLEIPKSFLRKKYGIPAPAGDEEVIGGQSATADEKDGEFAWGDEESEDADSMEAGDGTFHGNQYVTVPTIVIPDEKWTGTPGQMRERATQIMKGLKDVDHPTLGKVLFTRLAYRKGLSMQKTPHGFQAVTALRELVQHGKVVSVDPDNKGRPEVRAFKTLETNLRIGKSTYRVETTIMESTDGKAYAHRFYFHRLRHPDGSPVKAKTAGPYISPAFQPGDGPSGMVNMPPAQLVVKLQEIAAIEDDALFAKSLQELSLS